jgi:hypothetical protein
MSVASQYSGTSPTVSPAKAPFQSSASYAEQSRQAAMAKQALDRIATDYASRGEGIAGQIPSAVRERAQTSAANVRQSMTPMVTDPFAGLDLYEYSGGPNSALISGLNAQREQLQKNYATNKADANNLYGILSSDIEEYGAGLQTRYQESAGKMSAAETARNDALIAEQAAQEARRAAAAAELGLSAESLQMAPDTTMDELMATNAGAASNWANLFEANRLREDASTGRQLAGATATKNQQLMAMKSYLDQQQSMLDQQIAMERSKSPTQTLTALGRGIESKVNEGIINQLFPEAPELTPRQQNVENAMRDLQMNPNDPRAVAAFSALQESAARKFGNKALLQEEPLTRAEMIALRSMDVPVSYFYPDASQFTNR